MDTPTILTKAAEVIETRGWCQGDYYPLGSDPDTAPVCASAAISVAAGLRPEGRAQSTNDVDAWLAKNAARKAFRRHLAAKDNNFDGIPNWNDASERTPEQVISALRECAAELEASA